MNTFLTLFLPLLASAHATSSGWSAMRERTHSEEIQNRRITLVAQNLESGQAYDFRPALLTLEDLVDRDQANVDNESVLVFGGKVGRLEAIFHIEWDTRPANILQGHYYYPSRGRERGYRLEGSLTKDGGLNLREFTRKPDGSEELSATCILNKRISGDRVIFEGTMKNTDGRSFPMSFSRIGLAH